MPPQQQAAQQQQGQQGKSAFTFEQFAGVNTATVRAGVPDEQAYWLDGFMPLAMRQLRTLWGLGPSVYTVHDGNSVVMFGFYNIGAVPYAAIFESDGSAYQYNLNSAAVTLILPAGSIALPSPLNIGVSQYGQQYLLIVSTVPNGYWIWDGNVLYSAGSLAPGVDLTNVGAGYVTPPFVNVTGGHGGGAVLSAQVANGVVTGVSILNAGSGWIGTDNTGSLSTVTLVFSGGSISGSGASLAAAMGHHVGGSGASVTPAWTNITSTYWDLIGIGVNAAGSGYSGFTTAYWSDGNGQWLSGGVPTLIPNHPNGSIIGVQIIAAPSNPNLTWQVLGSPAFPTIVIADPGYFSVSSVSVVAPGSGYGPNTGISVSGGSPFTTAVFSPALSGGNTGSFTSVLIDNPGVYTTSVAPTLVVTDSTTTAAGTVNLMPFGISGTAIQTYAGHVWVFNGNVFNFSAPGSVWNFATSAGGGSDQSSDNFLKVGYIQAIQTNGFLFVLGDSSMNYISGVTTTGTPPTTTFTNQNSDPEIGTPYPYAVITVGQDILAANSTGIFVSSGGGFAKRSEAFDGVYNTVPNFAGLQLSAAKATIFGKRVWMVLVPIIDPVNGTPPQATNAITSIGSPVLNFATVPASIDAGDLVYDVTNPTAFPAGTTVLSTTPTTVTLSNNAVIQVGSGDTIVFFVQKILMFNGKQWWTSEQDVGLTFIAGQEINSTFTAWGTDGTNIYPLFNTPSVNFTKTAQTKYWDDPGYEGSKTATRFWSLWQIYSTTGTSFTLGVDAVGLDASNNQFVNTQTIAMNANGATGTVIPTVPEAVGQQGVLLGFTISTNAPDMALVSAKLLPDVYQYRG